MRHKHTISETAAKFLNLIEGSYGYIAAMCIRHLDGVDAVAYGPFKTERLANNFINREASKLEDDTTSTDTIVFDARQASPPPNSKVELWYGYTDEGVPFVTNERTIEGDDFTYVQEEEVKVLIPGEEPDDGHDNKRWGLLLRKLRERFRFVSEDNLKAITSPLAISADRVVLYVRDTSPFFKHLENIPALRALRGTERSMAQLRAGQGITSTDIERNREVELAKSVREIGIPWYKLTPNVREEVIQALRLGGFDFKA